MGRKRLGWIAAAFGLLAAFLFSRFAPFVPRQEPQALGMVLIDISDEVSAATYHLDELGVYVLAVEENGLAQQAGIQSGDRVVSLNGTAVHTTDAFAAAQARAGQVLEIGLCRTREKHTVVLMVEPEPMGRNGGL